MTLDTIIVDALGLAAIGLIIWYFWLSKGGGVTATVEKGMQSALIVVRGGYTPDTVVVARGRPVRLVFRREESALCSERVVLPAFEKSAVLPQGEEVAVEFLPAQTGEFPFSCQMGMFKGRVIVE